MNRADRALSDPALYSRGRCGSCRFEEKRHIQLCKGLGGRGFANGPEGKSTPEFDTCVDLEKRLCTSEIEIAVLVLCGPWQNEGLPGRKYAKAERKGAPGIPRLEGPSIAVREGGYPRSCPRSCSRSLRVEARGRSRGREAAGGRQTDVDAGRRRRAVCGFPFPSRHRVSSKSVQ